MVNFEPHMPEVDVVADPDEIVAKAREMAAQVTSNGRGPVAITPGHRLLFPLGSVPPNSKSAAEVAPIEQMVPRNPPLNITVIALNTVETLMDGGWARSIPFAGYLLGMAYIGHNVIVTEGHPSFLAAACRGADLLIVDGGMLPFLQQNWSDVALENLRTPKVLILNRDGMAQRLVKSAESGDPPARSKPAFPLSNPPKPKPWWKLW